MSYAAGLHVQGVWKWGYIHASGAAEVQRRGCDTKHLAKAGNLSFPSVWVTDIHCLASAICIKLVVGWTLKTKGLSTWFVDLLRSKGAAVECCQQLARCSL